MSHINSLVLIGGTSGAGKSTALDILSDLGFSVIRNLPIALFSNFLELTKSNEAKYSKTALILDIDTSESLNEFFQVTSKLNDLEGKIYFVFLDSTNETIIRRYSETRRPHPEFEPLTDKTLNDTINRERTRLLPLKEKAHLSFDTTGLNRHDLKRELKKFVDSLSLTTSKYIRVNFLSFGFKWGLPLDCDLVADVRFLKNPHFVDELREKTGLESEVSSYVFESNDAHEFVKRYTELLHFLLPKYVEEGKSYLNVGIGCTGGKHRSVAIAERLAREADLEKLGYLVSVKHRDIERSS